MRANLPDQLGNVLFGKAKRAIFSQLFGRPDTRFYVRELARAANVTPSTLSRDLTALASAGVIVRVQEGRQVYYQANPASPVYQELRGLITKTFGIADVLRQMLAPVAERVCVAAVYGSVAKGTHVAKSDVDLLIVGDIRSAQIADELIKAEEALARSISPTIYPRGEFAKAARDSPFLKAIMERPLLFLIGDKHELKRVREGSPANSH